MFHIPGEHDLEIIAALMTPLLAANIVIMLPSWSSWALPKIGPEDINVEAGHKKAAASKKASGGSGAFDSVSSRLGTSNLTVGGVTSDQPSDGSKGVPASSWGRTEKGRNVKSLKDALHLAQSHYAANNPTGHFNFAAEMLIASVNCMAIELLYRGTALTLISEWLCDRYYEAGLEDLAIPFRGPMFDIPELARWSAVTLVITASAALAVRKV